MITGLVFFKDFKEIQAIPVSGVVECCGDKNDDEHEEVEMQVSVLSRKSKELKQFTVRFEADWIATEIEGSPIWGYYEKLLKQ